MGVACSFLGHRPSGKTIWNDGHNFSTCARCRTILVEAESGGWKAPPKGYRVVWKQRDAAADYLRPAAAERGKSATASPLQEKRAGRDRRQNSGGALPSFLGGIDRRRGDRRKSSGNYRANRRKALIAQSTAED